MKEKVVILDKRGRITLPKEIRDKVKAKKFKIKLVNDQILLQPVDDDVDKYFGIFKGEVHKDVDEIFNEAMEEHIKNEEIFRR